MGRQVGSHGHQPQPQARCQDSRLWRPSITELLILLLAKASAHTSFGFNSSKQTCIKNGVSAAFIRSCPGFLGKCHGSRLTIWATSLGQKVYAIVFFWNKHISALFGCHVYEYLDIWARANQGWTWDSVLDLPCIYTDEVGMG